MRQRWCEKTWGMHAQTNPSESCNIPIHHKFPKPSQCAAGWHIRHCQAGWRWPREAPWLCSEPDRPMPRWLSLRHTCGVAVRGDAHGCTGGVCNACSAARAQPGTSSVSLGLAGTHPAMSFPDRTWLWEVTVPAKAGTPSRTMLCPRTPTGTVAPQWELSCSSSPQRTQGQAQGIRTSQKLTAECQH